jgi:hypothetical protein
MREILSWCASVAFFVMDKTGLLKGIGLTFADLIVRHGHSVSQLADSVDFSPASSGIPWGESASGSPIGWREGRALICVGQRRSLASYRGATPE